MGQRRSFELFGNVAEYDLWLLAQILTLLAAAGALALGLIIALADRPEAALWIWGTGLLPALAYLCAEIFVKLRQGNVGLDVVAAMSMALALATQQTLAGIVVALMYSGGQMLERFAEHRARREMSALLSRSPKVAARHSDRTIEEVAVEAIVPGDRLLVKSGEAVPTDGMLTSDLALLDESVLTGESLPAQRRVGEPVLSGSINIGSPFDLLVTQPAAKSRYAAIVRLVENAQKIKAPMVRLADHYGIWFLIVTLTIVGVAWLSADPVRALAVLVVATPCPLILAVPVAIMSGISHAAKHGVLVKDGAALETLARIRTVVIDKTGTLTEGRARVISVQPQAHISSDELLRLAATLDLASHHVVATALVAAATDRGLSLGRPSDVHEAPGIGIEGLVDGHRVALGGGGYVAGRLAPSSAPVVETLASAGQFCITVAVDSRLAGQFLLADSIRPDISDSIDRFRAAGITRIVLASGDRPDIARSVGAKLNIDEIQAALTPEEKVATVVRERQGGCVMMVGDGINDAPALAAADLGVAMGARGAAASSEAADIVLLVDRIGALADATEIARRARRMALQSANIGVGLSLAAMMVAAAGYLPPVQGALLQELIDVGVVLNALRALAGGPRHLTE